MTLPPSSPAPTLDEAAGRAEHIGRHLFRHQFLVAFDAAQRGCYVSAHAPQVLGYPEAQLTAELLQAAIHPADRPLVARAAALAQEFGGYTRRRLPADATHGTADATHGTAAAEGAAAAPVATEARAPAAALVPSCLSIDYRLRQRAGTYLRVLRQTFVLAQDAAGQPLLTAQLFTDISGHKTSDDVRFSIDHADFAAWVRSRRAHRPDDPLSAREQEILARILAGATNAALCAELFISELTLKTHRRNIHRKLKTFNI